MTAPDMVSVIAAALAEHEAELDTSGDCYTGYCTCNQKVPYVDHAAHQARAVLAAISEAGAVEWGVENGHTPIDHVDETDDQDEAADIASDRRGIGIPARVVSRISGPWTAVE